MSRHLQGQTIHIRLIQMILAGERRVRKLLYLDLVVIVQGALTVYWGTPKKPKQLLYFVLLTPGRNGNPEVAVATVTLRLWDEELVDEALFVFDASAPVICSLNILTSTGSYPSHLIV